MLFTKKGDDGKTKLFGCDQRISKSSAITEALGVLDETNSFLGLCKIKSDSPKIIHQIQENLFIIQSQVAGSDKFVTKEKIEEIENIINEIEKELPEIKTFFISGGSELSSMFDFARTLARRAERRVVAVNEDPNSASQNGQWGIVKIDENTLKYLNRLSSLLYALARLVNKKSNIEEKSPRY